MARIVDYPIVLRTLIAAGFTCLYHNSGSFGFTASDGVDTIGWMGPEDPSIRPAARAAITLHVSPPYSEVLARMLSHALRVIDARTVWIMPRSHWAYELDFGNATWLPDSLLRIGVESSNLAPRNNGAAIECDLDECKKFVTDLIDQLSGSDFMLVVPHRGVICTIHHHKQLWWQTNDSSIAQLLRAMSTD